MADDSTAGGEQATEDEEQLPPQGHVKVVYLGPVAPHWEVHDIIGDRAVIDAFRQRVTARLQLLPPHDPQFHRNRARVDRDAERERLVIEWDLGFDEPDAVSPAAAAESPTPEDAASPAPATGPDDTEPTADASEAAEPESESTDS
ncbi:MAG: hypothetical protein R3A49_09435 [Acidimicrobiia bacterium]